MIKDIFVGIAITVVAAWMLWLSNTMHTQAVAMARVVTEVSYIKEHVKKLDDQILLPAKFARHDIEVEE